MELTILELALAAFVACQRNADGIAAGANPHKYGYEGNSLDDHFKGCCGEIVVAKFLNRYWTGAGVGYKDDNDVGNLQVRATPYLNGHLPIYASDNDDHYFILVVGEPPTFFIPGWIKASDGKRQEWWRSISNGRSPQFWVPQSSLNPDFRR